MHTSVSEEVLEQQKHLAEDKMLALEQVFRSTRLSRDA